MVYCLRSTYQTRCYTTSAQDSLNHKSTPICVRVNSLLPKLVIFTQHFIVSGFVWDRSSGTAHDAITFWWWKKVWHSSIVESIFDGTCSGPGSSKWTLGSIGSKQMLKWIAISRQCLQKRNPMMWNNITFRLNQSMGANQLCLGWIHLTNSTMFTSKIYWIDLKFVDLSLRNKTSSSFIWCLFGFSLFSQKIPSKILLPELLRIKKRFSIQIIFHASRRIAAAVQQFQTEIRKND